MLFRWAFLVALVVAHGAFAQEPLVLRPGSFSAVQGREIALATETVQAKGTVASDWPTAVDWYFIRLAGTQENRGPQDAPRPAAGEPHKVVFPVPGTAMVGLDLTPQTQLWSPAALSSFARESGVHDPCATSDAKVQLLRSATTVLRVNDGAGKPSADTTASSKSGQQVEIRPLMDPTTMLPGGDLPVRLYMKGSAAGGAVVAATHVATGAGQQATADPSGIALLHIAQPGEYRLELRVLRPLAESDAAWQAGIGTLTFEVPKPPEPETPSAPAKEEKP